MHFKINRTLIESPDEPDIFMSMYNLLGYSQNYSVTSESLWNYYKDEIDNINDNTTDGKSFKYKKLVGKTPARPGNERNPNRAAITTFND